MKIIYKSLMTIAFAGLSLASCDKELKEETAMEVGVVTDSNVSFDGKTVTVKKGNPVTFSFDGDPDFISFFSGEIGHEYKPVSYTHLRAHETDSYLVCRLLLEKKKKEISYDVFCWKKKKSE